LEDIEHGPKKEKVPEINQDDKSKHRVERVNDHFLVKDPTIK